MNSSCFTNLLLLKFVLFWSQSRLFDGKYSGLWWRNDKKF